MPQASLIVTNKRLVIRTASGKTAAVKFAPGAKIFLYSDGLVERPDRTVGQSTVEVGQAVSDALAGRPALSGASTHPPDRVCEQALELLTRISGYADDGNVDGTRRSRKSGWYSPGRAFTNPSASIAERRNDGSFGSRASLGKSVAPRCQAVCASASRWARA